MCAKCSTLLRQPTEQEATRINDLLQQVNVVNATPPRIEWNGNKAELFDLSWEIGGYRPTKNCYACHLQALNILRTSVGLPPLTQHAEDSERAQRMAICSACPIFVPSTQSCGTLVVDHLRTRTVTLPDGRSVTPCGCYLPLKTWIKTAHCPAQRW